jgi:hypothetical protein
LFVCTFATSQIPQERLRKKKEEEEAMWSEYIEQRKKQRSKEEEELKKLKERQVKSSESILFAFLCILFAVSFYCLISLDPSNSKILPI